MGKIAAKPLTARRVETESGLATTPTQPLQGCTCKSQTAPGNAIGLFNVKVALRGRPPKRVLNMDHLNIRDADSLFTIILATLRLVTGTARITS